MVIVMMVLVPACGGGRGLSRASGSSGGKVQRDSATAAELAICGVGSPAQAAKSSCQETHGIFARKGLAAHGLDLEALDGKPCRRDGFFTGLRAPQLGFQVLKEFVHGRRRGARSLRAAGARVLWARVIAVKIVWRSWFLAIQDGDRLPPF